MCQSSLRNPSHAAHAFPSLTSLSFQLPATRNVVPSWLAHLPSLLHLSLDAHEDGGTPLEIDSLPNCPLPLTLQSLHLRNLGLHALPESLGRLQHLTELRMLRLWRIPTLPESLGDLPQLQLLQIHECSSLRSLPQSLTRLGCLSILDIHSCQRLTSTLPHLGFGLRSSLCACRFSAYQSFLRLPSFPTDLTSCADLEILSLSSKTQTQVPDSLGGLRKLRRLRLDMERLVNLPDVFASLASLTELCPLSEALEELPASAAAQPGTRPAHPRPLLPFPAPSSPGLWVLWQPEDAHTAVGATRASAASWKSCQAA